MGDREFVRCRTWPNRQRQPVFTVVLTGFEPKSGQWRVRCRPGSFSVDSGVDRRLRIGTEILPDDGVNDHSARASRPRRKPRWKPRRCVFTVDTRCLMTCDVNSGAQSFHARYLIGPDESFEPSARLDVGQIERRPIATASRNNGWVTFERGGGPSPFGLNRRGAITPGMDPELIDEPVPTKVDASAGSDLQHRNGPSCQPIDFQETGKQNCRAPRLVGLRFTFDESRNRSGMLLYLFDRGGR